MQQNLALNAQLAQQRQAQSEATQAHREQLEAAQAEQEALREKYDIKAAKVLITNEGAVKLASFCVAGSPYWMAPEIIEMPGQLTPACDIWAVGATAFELFMGHPLRIVQDPHPENLSGANTMFQQFMFQCFCNDASRRPSA